MAEGTAWPDNGARGSGTGRSVFRTQVPPYPGQWPGFAVGNGIDTGFGTACGVIPTGTCGVSGVP